MPELKLNVFTDLLNWGNTTDNMKKKFLEIIRHHGFILVEYESWQVSHDRRNYQISYKNRKSDVFSWFGKIDTCDDSISVLDEFKGDMLINRGGR